MSLAGAAALTGYLVMGGDALEGTPLFGYGALTAALGLMTVVSVWRVSAGVSHGRVDVLEPPVWYTLWTLVCIVLFGLFAFTGDPKYRLDVPVSQEAIVAGLWLPLLGLASLWLGYGLTRAALAVGFRSMTSTPLPWQPLKATVLPFYLGLCAERLWRIATVGTAFGSATALEELSGLNQWSIYLEESVYLVIAVTGLQVFRRQWRAPYLVAMVAVELVFALLTGYSKPLLWLAMALFGAWQYAGHRVRLSSLWRWAAILLVALLALPIVEQYRSLVAEGAVNSRSPVAAAERVVQSAQQSWGTDPGAAGQVLVDKLTGRQALVAQTLGLVVDVTPSVIPFWGVERLLAIPSYVVPRFLWPDKPNLNTGAYFSIVYLNAPEDTATSSAFTMYGDLYVSAGWGATIGGMIVLGVVSALLYQRLVVAPLGGGRPPLTALYIALAIGMLDVEGSYTGIMVGLMQRLVLYTAVFWVLHLPRRRLEQAQHLPGRGVPGEGAGPR